MILDVVAGCSSMEVWGMRVMFHPECGYREPVITWDTARNSSEYTVEGLWRYIVEYSSFELEEVTTISQGLLGSRP